MRATEVITATKIDTMDDVLVVYLNDRAVSVRWEVCSPALASATREQRQHAELSPGGYGIHWPLIDEDLSIGGLVKGQSM